MVIMGLDPGSRRTGYGVLTARGSDLRLVETGVIAPRRSASLGERLLVLHDGLAERLERLRPDVVALEESFVGRHARAALILGHARGSLIVAVLAAGLPLHEYAPRLVKLAATGSGRASKEQIQAMVPRLVAGVPEALSADEADALAVAICHAHRLGVAWRAAEASGVRT